eukprot:365800-Chlamydomonas_euryale.AAC.37
MNVCARSYSETGALTWGRGHTGTKQQSFGPLRPLVRGHCMSVFRLDSTLPPNGQSACQGSPCLLCKPKAYPKTRESCLRQFPCNRGWYHALSEPLIAGANKSAWP